MDDKADRKVKEAPRLLTWANGSAAHREGEHGGGLGVQVKFSIGCAEFKMSQGRNSCCGSMEMNPTRMHEDVCLIPGLTQ